MDFAAARRTMVENQLRTNRVTDPLVVAAMSDVPREAFVPPALKGIAYADEDLDLGGGRYLMEPLVLARLLQTVAVERTDKALIVGCASGYGAAILARLAGSVVALEADARCADQARTVLADLGFATVSVVCGPLAAGWPEGAPYDVVVFAGAVAEVPQAVLDQVGEDGRLAAMTLAAGGGGLEVCSLYTRVHGTIGRRTEFEAATPLLPGFAPKPKFVF